MNAAVTHPTTLHSDTATPWADARRLTHQLPAPLASEDVALAAAAGRTLAQPLRAATMLPGFDNAGMDGYAVRGLGPWRLTGRVLAGDTRPAAMGVGEAVEVGTGAVLPIGADRVVPYEDADRDGDLISGTGGKAHIRRAGEYVHAGHELLPVGHVLTAAAVGLAASVGLDTVTVRDAPACNCW